MDFTNPFDLFESFFGGAGGMGGPGMGGRAARSNRPTQGDDERFDLTIDFLGPWNEKDDQFASSGMFYLKALRKELDSRGFQSTKLVYAPDSPSGLSALFNL